MQVCKIIDVDLEKHENPIEDTVAELLDVDGAQLEEYSDRYTFCNNEKENNKHILSTIDMHCRKSKVFDIKNMWYGVIDEIKGDNYYCRILDSMTEIEELIDFEIEDFSFDDKELLYPGATFQFFIGYHKLDTGQKTRASLIKLDRYPIDRSDENRTSKFIQELNTLKRQVKAN